MSVSVLNVTHFDVLGLRLSLRHINLRILVSASLKPISTQIVGAGVDTNLSADLKPDKSTL